ncbi:MAG: Gfo/Idh/MocA family protein [Pirellulales bacterium]
MPRTFRVAAIGSTQHGGYGHGLDTAYVGLENTEYVAVADDDPAGLEAAIKRLGAARGYASYQQMLDSEKLDVVSIGPRHVTDRVAMVSAAAARGIHLFCEKPLAGSLADADAMLLACQQAGVKMAVAHQFRAMPPLRKIHADIRGGKFGRLLRMRARPKDDHRGGGEELAVHGTHLFDLMVWFAGPPRWVSGDILAGGRPATLHDTRQGTEPVGPIAGDSLSGAYGFDDGVRGYFDSTANLYRDGQSPYGLLLECERALLHIRGRGEVYVYPAAALVPENPELTWERTWIEDWHFHPDHTPRPLNDYLHRGNQSIVRSLYRAIQENLLPLTPAADARWALEMIQGVYASHLQQGFRLPLPLADRQHPLSREE